MNLAQIPIKLETLNLSMILRMFLIVFDNCKSPDSYKKDSFKKETVYTQKKTLTSTENCFSRCYVRNS